MLRAQQVSLHVRSAHPESYHPGLPSSRKTLLLRPRPPHAPVSIPPGSPPKAASCPLLGMTRAGPPALLGGSLVDAATTSLRVSRPSWTGNREEIVEGQKLFRHLGRSCTLAECNTNMQRTLRMAMQEHIEYQGAMCHGRPVVSLQLHIKINIVITGPLPTEQRPSDPSVASSARPDLPPRPPPN